MDNIGQHVSAISCLLPLLVSVLLALHFIQHSKRPHNDDPDFQDDISASVCSTVDRNIQTRPIVLTPIKAAVKSNQSVKDSQWTKIATVNRSEEIERESRLLVDCSSGLTKMRLINRAYFNSGKAANQIVQIRKIRHKKGEFQLKGFLPTDLPTIIEGLQY